MSMTPVPVCWQTTVTAENKKECALAHSRAEARLPRQPSTLAPSAHPRGAFLSYGNEVSYTMKRTAVRNISCMKKLRYGSSFGFVFIRLLLRRE